MGRTQVLQEVRIMRFEDVMVDIGAVSTISPNTCPVQTGDMVDTCSERSFTHRRPWASDGGDGDALARVFGGDVA